MTTTTAFGGPPRAGVDRGDTIGVGIVGLSATAGWGAGAHVPALSAAGGFELRGLVGGSTATARAASEVHGVPAYPSVEQLAEAEGIDLVVVTVRTPRHRELVLPALAAGRPVFCEWPLAVDLEEAEEIAAAARAVSTFVGLQGRSSPTFRWLAELVSDGYVGDVLSATVSSTVTEWGGPVEERMLYTLDRRLGATMLGVAFGHAIDAVSLVVGELQDVVATTAVRHPLVRLGGGDRLVPMTADDQIAVSGRLPNGAVLSVHQRGGTAAGSGFSMVIDGTLGTLEATARDHPHVAPVTARGARRGEPLTTLTRPDVDDPYRHLAQTSLHTLAHAYAGIGRTLRGGPRTVPDFADAVKRHRLLDAITRSGENGRRITL
jgi:predicted dehydrogenase